MTTPIICMYVLYTIYSTGKPFSYTGHTAVCLTRNSRHWGQNCIFCRVVPPRIVLTYVLYSTKRASQDSQVKYIDYNHIGDYLIVSLPLYSLTRNSLTAPFGGSGFDLLRDPPLSPWSASCALPTAPASPLSNGANYSRNP